MWTEPKARDRSLWCDAFMACWQQEDRWAYAGWGQRFFLWLIAALYVHIALEGMPAWDSGTL